MPLYEYQCADCHAEVELLIRGDEQPQCPQCQSDKLQRLLSVASAHMASQSLPMSMPGGGCGKPQCGQGRCMGGM